MSKALEFVNSKNHIWPSCPAYHNLNAKCTCGRDDAIEQLSKVSEDSEMLDWLSRRHFEVGVDTNQLGDNQLPCCISNSKSPYVRDAIRQEMKENKG